MKYTRQQEIIELRKYPRHYLQNVVRWKWTDQDIENLFNGSKNPDLARKHIKIYGQRVSMTDNGVVTEFDSIPKAVKSTGITIGTLRGVLKRGIDAHGRIWKKID